MRTSFAFAFALVLAAACGGMAGVRDHAEALVVATHCQRHACPAAPHARLLGERCYVVGDRLYQCSTNRLPAGQASCFEIDFAAGTRTYIRTVHNGRELSTRRCRDLWRADHAARRVRAGRAGASHLEGDVGRTLDGAPKGDGRAPRRRDSARARVGVQGMARVSGGGRSPRRRGSRSSCRG